MKIICFEEHTIDQEINEATQQAMATEAGYMADLGSRANDNPTDPSQPQLTSMQKSLELARDVGTGRIATMDEHGIDMQILSYSNSTQMAPSERALDLARAANDKLAEAVRANPTRFRGFATLPWQVPEAAAVELERAVKQLGLVGTLLIGHIGPGFLDDERYESILAKLNELKVPVYVHPGPPLPQVREPYYAGFSKEVSARFSLFGWGWHNEAGIQLIRMILAGKFDKFPQLQVISGHWGEMVPFFLQRMDDAMPQDVTELSRTITETYREHVYVTPSGMLYLPHFEFIYKVVGPDRILYAVDYPYLTLSGARQFLESLPVSEEDKEKIAHKNAEAVLRL